MFLNMKLKRPVGGGNGLKERVMESFDSFKRTDSFRNQAKDFMKLNHSQLIHSKRADAQPF